MESKRIYFDHAATTPLDESVLKSMLPYFTERFGNPNSQHYFGREAMNVIDEAREGIAKILNCKSNEVYFTSDGTESDNWAIKGVARANRDKGNHIIVSSIEHPAVLESVKALKKEGFSVDYIPVDEKGTVDLNALKSLIRKETVLIACMLANNEVGTIEPIKEISEIAKENKIIFFSDAVQCAGALDLNVKELGVDLLSVSSHKIYGPKGVGALFVKSGIKIDGILNGGHQEKGKRGGTTNVPEIVGFYEAFKIAERDREKNNKYVTSLRDRFIDGIIKNVPIAKLNGSKTDRLPANADICFYPLSGEEILFNLDLNGVCASMGSACSTGSVEPSHVLTAMGLSEKEAKSSIRFSFGKNNKKEEIDFAISIIKETVNKLAKGKTLFKTEVNADKEC